MARRATTPRRKAPAPAGTETANLTTTRSLEPAASAIPSREARREEHRGPAPVQQSTEQLLTFLMGSDEYGISILRVREIAEYRPLTPVPMRPAWMRGVTNLRGTVVPVVDLAAKLGLPPTTISRLTCLIIVDLEIDDERTVVGVMVDAVRRVVDVARDDIQEAPPFGMAVDVVPGLVRVDGELIILLDLTTIVSEKDLVGAAEMLPSLREVVEAADARG